MELISYEQFGKLRLKQFVPANKEIFDSDGHEWMNGWWINEGIGITGISRHEDTPDEAGGLEVLFSELSASATVAMLDAIRLPLHPGMTFENLRSVLGEPQQTEFFPTIPDRKHYKFTIGSEHPYHVSCTIHDTDGLIGIAVIRNDVLSKIKAAPDP